MAIRSIGKQNDRTCDNRGRNPIGFIQLPSKSKKTNTVRVDTSWCAPCFLRCSCIIRSLWLPKFGWWLWNNTLWWWLSIVVIRAYIVSFHTISDAVYRSVRVRKIRRGTFGRALLQPVRQPNSNSRRQRFLYGTLK